MLYKLYFLNQIKLAHYVSRISLEKLSTVYFTILLLPSFNFLIKIVIKHKNKIKK
jgi:hypothetical protein